VSKNESGTAFYVDFDRIRKHEGFFYYWELSTFLPAQKGQPDTELRVRDFIAAFHT
jgi:hypothetical protein